MWKTKVFLKESTARAWIKKHKDKYDAILLFINNGFAVDYKPLRIIKF